MSEFLVGDSTTASVLTIDLDNAFTGGFGIGYNAYEHLNLNVDFYFTGVNVTGSGLGVSASSNTFLWGMDVNLDVLILASRLTPVVTAGLGFMSFSGNFSGVEFQETDFSYNVGGGLRWDFADNWFVKFLYRARFTTLQDADDSLVLNGFSLSIGYLY